MTTPEKIGPYVIQKELGRGGMASVFLAHDTRFERDVAVKILPQHFLHDPNFRLRFEREAKTIAALEHPAIVPVHDFGEVNGQPYLVMRYMPGGTLTQHAAAGHFTLEKARPIVNKIASALDFAHQRGVIHRDLKPDNVLFDQLGLPYLSDFGIAKLAAQTQTMTQGIIGTPAYMSPEQWRAKDTLDGRCDQYALTIILYQLLTGRLPYTANATTGYMLAHVNEPVPQISQVLPTTPEGIDEFIKKGMAKNREDRFSSLEEWSIALDQVGTPGFLLPSSSSSPMDSQPASPAMETLLEDEAFPTEIMPGQGQKSSRPLWQWAAAAVAVVSIIGLGAFLMSTLGQGEDPAVEATSAPAVVVEELTPEPNPEPTQPATEIAAVVEEETTAVPATVEPTAEPTATLPSRPTATAVAIDPPDNLGIAWLEIPEGPLMMGASPGDALAFFNEQPLHETFVETFWISEFEITNAQYKAFVDATDYPVPFRSRDDFAGMDDATFDETIKPYLDESNWNPKTGDFPEGKGDHPVTVVSWVDALAFADWLSQETGLTITLPSEAEWEKAARGDGEPLIYPWGDEFDGGRLNYCDANCLDAVRDPAINDGYFVTAPVGSFGSGASPFGVQDMVGNVREWTRSALTDQYPYSDINESTDPQNPALRIVRGGDWQSDAAQLRVSARVGFPPDTRNGITGFRLVILP